MPAPRTVRTMCPMNCHPTLCGMLVDIDDRGQLASVRGDPANPDSRGFLCGRGRATREIVGNPARVLHPMRRVARSGSWQRTTWGSALDHLALRAREVGPEALGLWSGHGLLANSYGTRIQSELLRRFANIHGCQWWSPAMICWGLGAFGLGLTGVLRVHTKEDLGEHASLVVLWGANLASQPNTGPHLAGARRRGARVVCIDVRRAEASAQADETLIVRPGTDAALALGMMHVIVRERLHDARFVAGHTVGFDDLAAHLEGHHPAWAAEMTGVPADRIAALARQYATVKPATIVLGGSSMHKGAGGWEAGRAVACLPALTGNLGVPGGGLGPRHGAAAHGQALSTIAAADRRPPGDYVPNQMSRVGEAIASRRVRVLLLFGTDMLSSFAEAGSLGAGLAGLDLLASHDLFFNDTARRHADLVLPATAWLEDVGCKSTNTHLYLMPKAIDAPGEARSATWVLRELACRLGLRDFFPWSDDAGPIDAILDHPSTGNATVARLEAEGGIRALRVSHVAYPDLRFDTPSGKVEFFSSVAQGLGLPALPSYTVRTASAFPLALCTGRTMTHFHAFYDHGRALPSLASADPEPCVWISPGDAAARGIGEDADVRIFNARGEMRARAHVTARVPGGTLWMRDGWYGLNHLTSGAPVLPDAAVDRFGFAAGQAEYEANVDVAPC